MNQEQIQNTKGVNYYRKLLHYDTIVLLIVSILFVILSAIFIEKTNSEDSVQILLKSILFIIFEIIILVNKKEISKSVGILAVVNGALMVLTSIGDGSLFGIVYLLLGMLYIIHSAIYLNKLKKSDYNSQIGNFDTKQNTKLKYLTIIANILSLLFVIGLISEDMTTRIIIFATIIVINVINIIFCVFLNKKYSKSTLVYITMIISILAVLINGLILIDDVGSEIHKKRKYNSEAYTVERCQNTENAINNKITLLQNLTSLNIPIGENTIVQLDDYLALDNVSWIDVIDLQELEKDGYVCDGYTILNWNSNLDITDYSEVSSKMSYPFNMRNYFNKVETYIKCSGKYNYQTSGFNNNLLK